MHRIDSFGATQDNRFTEGDPVVPVPPTQVSADWLNAVQEEISHVVEGAGVSLDKQDNSQLLAAVNALVQAGTLVPGAPGTWLHVDEAGNIVWQSLPPVEKYDLCEFYYFRHPTLKPGFQPAQGGLIANAATLYPAAWEYLQTAQGQLLCKTEAQWQALTTAVWATLADGTTVGWNGIGGAPYFVQDLAAGTLRLPDLRGMYAEAAGFDTLGVGDVHGDAIRNITGSRASCFVSAPSSSGSWYHSTSSSYISKGSLDYQNYQLYMDASRMVPVAAKNQPRAWGALACVYLGAPK